MRANFCNQCKPLQDFRFSEKIFKTVETLKTVVWIQILEKRVKKSYEKTFLKRVVITHQDICFNQKAQNYRKWKRIVY
jgi:hypothetical protein